MKHGRSIIAPVLVLGIALITGGWFLQRGVEAQDNVYLQMRTFQEVLDHVERRFVESVDKTEVYDAAIEGVLESLGDPNTSLIDSEMWENFSLRSGTEAEYGGVGLEILRQEGWITVITPLPGGPAKRAGIRTGDLIVEIEGATTEEWDTDQAADVLRGTPGTDVDIVIRRPGVDQAIPFTITRAVIELKSVPFTSVLDEGIGYLPLQVFGETSTVEIRRAVEEMSGAGVRGLILDLRGNPGGLLGQGVDISDLFLDAGASIVDTRGRAPGQTESYAARTGQIATELPLVVLVNEGSASASEIVAGALQDHDRAVVVGGRSFGKGSVQTLYRLSGGDILRLTTALWYTPSGRSIQKDYEVQRSAQMGAGSTAALDGSRVERPELEDMPTVKSMSGRTLYGGGGIIPDIIVIPDTLATDEYEAVQRIYRAAGQFRTELFNYAVRYVQEHPGLEPGFRLESADFGAFYAGLAEAGLDLDRADLSQAERFVRYQLEREIALQAWGEEGQFQQVRDRDQQLLAAVELLRGSADSQTLFETTNRVVGEGGLVVDAPQIAVASRGN